MKARGTNRILWLVCGLTATGLLTVITTIGVVGWTLSHIRTERAGATSEQNHLNQTSDTLTRLLADAHSQFLTTFDETIPQTGANHAAADLANFVHAQLEPRPDAALMGPLLDLDQLTTNLARLSKQCDAWRESYVPIASDIAQGKTIGKVRALIANLRDAVDALQEKHHAQDAVLYSQWQSSFGQQASAPAGQIHSEERPTQYQSFADFNGQLADFARLVEVLNGEDQIDRLENLKDNQLVPALDQLGRSIQAFVNDPLNDGSISAQAIKTLTAAVFGAGYSIDRTHHTLQAAPGGLYILRTDSVALRHVRRALRHELNDLLDTINQSKGRFDQQAGDRAAVLAQEMEQAVADGWVRMLWFGAGCAVIFLWLATTISRGIYGQATAMEEARAEAQARTVDLRRAATHDRLTGLPNRTMFHERLSHALEIAKRQKGFLLAVLFLDFDRFKIVNDSLGHEAGDLLLKAIGERLMKTLRSTDAVGLAESTSTTARLGGDEFCVLLSGLSCEADASHTAERILKELEKPYDLTGRQVHSTVSIGIAISSSGYEKAEDMIRDADTAMYRAKTEGKNRFVIFDQPMHEQAMRRLTVESELRRALETNALEPYFQPIISLETSRLAGAEALIRWNHPDRGLIEADDFIGIAEESGLINLVGGWMLSACCRQIKDWQQRFPDVHLAVSVNVSGKQLAAREFVAQVESAVRENGISPQDLILEVTETALVSNVEHSIAALLDLREKGFRVCLDDFGTGYSSLSMLHTFKLDGLKIDQSFVREAAGRRQYAAIIQAITDLAHNLGMEVVAEGVEQEDQLALLQSLNCEMAQGFLFARPLPASDFEKFFQNSASDALWPKKNVA